MSDFTEEVKLCELYTKTLLNIAHKALEKEEMFEFLLAYTAVAAFLRDEFPDLVNQITSETLKVSNKGERIN